MGALNLKIENEIAVLAFDLPGSRVNTLDAAVMGELSAAIDEVAAKKPKALVITSLKDGVFIAGADIKGFERIKNEAEAETLAREGQEIYNKLAALEMPTVAGINGACLGGGFELALACKYRLAGTGSKVKIGLPEVSLGILPGWGGTQRLPRLAGLSRALELILTARIISGKDALKYGIVDRLYPETLLAAGAVDFALEVLAGRLPAKKKKRSLLQAFLEDTPPGRALMFSQAAKKVLEKTKGFYPAPLKALEVIKATCGGEIAAGLELERKGLAALAVTEVSRNLVKVFFLNEKFKKFPWVDGSVKPLPVDKCAVAGAGIMGGGIAQLVSSRDIPARVKDINYEALKQALRTADGIYRYALKKRKMNKYQAAHKMGLISPTLTYSGFKNAGLVIEAVVEDLGIKQKVFQELEENTSQHTILASNTSSLTISAIGEKVRDKSRLAGMHFFNPVNRMPLVEVIKTEHTSPETLATVIAFARKLGKIVVVTKDSPGFLVNRILVPYLNEAALLVEEGMPIERIDAVAKAFGMPMGPIELIDEVGIDVGAKVAKILEKAYGDRMRVSGLLEATKHAGLLGKKKNKGFYIYGDGEKKVNPGIYGLVQAAVKREIPDETALKRMIYGMINEAGRCLEEKVVDDAQAVDIAMIMGTGFPPFRGGLWQYAEDTGLANIVIDLAALEKEFGAPRFSPCAYLSRR